MLCTFSILDYVISLWLLRVDSSEAEGQRLVFPGSVERLRRFVHILLVDNELAQPKTNGGTMERAARNKEGESEMMEEKGVERIGWRHLGPRSFFFVSRLKSGFYVKNG